MSLADQIMQRGASVLARKFGRSGHAHAVLYFADDSAEPVALSFPIVGSEHREEYADDTGIRVRTVRQLLVITQREHKEFCGVENPLLTASISIDGIKYAATDIKSMTWGAASIKLRRVTQAELSRPGLRRTTR